MRAKVHGGGGGGNGPGHDRSSSSSHRRASGAATQQQRFVWRERSEKLNWRMLRSLHLPDVVRRGDPSVLEPFVLHLTFARLPSSAATVDALDADHGVGNSDVNSSRLHDSSPQRNAWFIVRIFQLATEYLLFMRSRDGTVLETLEHELRQCTSYVSNVTACIPVDHTTSHTVLCCCCLVRQRRSRRALPSGKRAPRAARSRSRSSIKCSRALQSSCRSKGAAVFCCMGTIATLQLTTSRSLLRSAAVSATPSAIATIETLLKDLVPRKRRARVAPDHNNNNDDDDDDEATDRAAAHRRVQAARQCYYCGKMFATAGFLAKHHARRHANEDSVPRVVMSAPAQSPPLPVANTVEPDTTSRTSDRALRQMLEQVEHALQDHQASLRALAQDEARKLERLFEHLHVESTLADEMKASREAVAQQVAAAQAQLDALESQKDDALSIVRDLQDQIQYLDAKRKVLAQQTDRDALSRSVTTDARPDVATAIEIKRLEHTLAAVNDALASAREELAKLQATHVTTLREKQALTEQASDAANHVKRLERAIAETSGRASVPAVHCDNESQTESVDTADASTETSAERAQVDAAVQTQAEAVETVALGVDQASQTDPVECDDAVVPLAPVERPSVQLSVETTAAFESMTEPSPVVDADADSVVSDYIFSIVAENVTDAVARRAQRYVSLSS